MFYSGRSARPIRFMLVAIFALAISGCADPKISKANLEKIKNGMSLKEVQDILGPGTKRGQGESGASSVASGAGIDLGGGITGTSRTPGGEIHDWESGARKITITFDNSGKVVDIRQKGL